MRFAGYIFALLMVFLPVSCSEKRESEIKGDDVLVSVGDSSLTMRDVLRRIPGGLDPGDSAMMFHTIVDTWVRDLVIREVAEKNVGDMERIERMVESYRTDLIISSYLSSMSDQVSQDIAEERVKDYYDTNKESMVLEQPLVKGALLKVPASSESLDRLRTWMTGFSEKDIDMIEKNGLKVATQYEYFKDNWQEWGAVTSQIPYRFFDADAFLSSTKNFETSEAGSVYLLHISEWLPTGSRMPYEYARLRIIEILRAGDVKNFRKRLLDDIYRRQIGEKVLRPGLYDPVGRKMREQPPAPAK